MPKGPEKILIMDGGGAGDMVMSSPTLKAIRNKFINSYIVILTVQRSGEVIKDLPYFDKLIYFDLEGFKNIYHLFHLKKIKHHLNLIGSLRKQKFDMMIDLTAIESWKAAVLRSIIFMVIGAKTHVGRNTDGRGYYLDIKVPEDLYGNMHDVERKFQIAKALGADLKNTGIEFKVPEKDRAFVNKWLEEKGILHSGFLVGLNPGSFMPSRRWCKEGFIEIGRRVFDKYGVQIIVTGGHKERRLVSDIVEGLHAVTPLKVLDFNIAQLGALIGRMGLFITNDTGAMHIASALNVPIVAIFGPENHNRFKPYGPSPAKIITPNTPFSCWPCVRYDCKKHECMKAITVDRVWNGVDLLMEKLVKEEKILYNTQS